ncbi:MAG: ThiF family adenylyltransferase [Proteobacteria bacterium]|nr:ThiF family adenylyltransferase [Pseudomonadota bacterium]MDA1062893.1 ThiF family adenylyltransferase [Pseudomonadota bacterium]
MNHDLERYQRQMLLAGIGEGGQRRLLESTVMILGCGALGCVVADLLARAGVGHLIIADRDYIELSNLQRQVLFDERDVEEGIPKAEAARRRIASINAEIRVTAIVDDINYGNIERYAAGVDLFVDGLDNIEARYLVNDLAVKSGRPYIYGAAVGTTGMTMPVLPHTAKQSSAWEQPDNFATPCFRCLFEEAPPPGSSATCDTVGVIGPAVGVIANLQVAEALKILTGNYARVSRTLLTLDLWASEILQLKVSDARESGNCPCCKRQQYEYLDGVAGSSADTLCGRNAVQLRHRQQAGGIDLDALATRLRKQGAVNSNEFMLRTELTDNGQRFELTLFNDGRAIIKGTNDASVARSVFAKYVGS